MKNKLLTILMLLTTTITYGQVKAVIVDSTTKHKIPFVNIWIEDENIGTTSNINGAFNLNANDSSKIIVFSSLGYESKKVKLGSITSIVKLKPKNTELQEVFITPRKQNIETVIGTIKRKNINGYFGCGTKPWIVARYFEYKEPYKQTPYLKKIKLLTKSDVRDSKFNIRFYSVNENGQPEDNIVNQNVIGVARKGKRTTEIDVSKLNIRFPEKGFFIAIEWLIIESNKYEYTYTMVDSKKKLAGISYEPSVGTVPSETDKNGWVYHRGKWVKIWKNGNDFKGYKDKYNLLAVELTLTN